MQNNFVHSEEKSEGIQDNLTMHDNNQEDNLSIHEDNQEDIIVEDSNFLLEMDYDESQSILASLFAPENIELDSHMFPDFGNQISNTYFSQDVKMYNGGEHTSYGGIRGVYWRS